MSGFTSRPSTLSMGRSRHLLVCARKREHERPGKALATKRAFLAELLAETDADVVGFKEVFSHEDLADFLRDHGYRWFHILTPAVRRTDDPDVFAAPTVAIASCFEIRGAT